MVWGAVSAWPSLSAGAPETEPEHLCRQRRSARRCTDWWGPQGTDRHRPRRRLCRNPKLTGARLVPDSAQPELLDTQCLDHPGRDRSRRRCRRYPDPARPGRARWSRLYRSRPSWVRLAAESSPAPRRATRRCGRSRVWLSSSSSPASCHERTDDPVNRETPVSAKRVGRSNPAQPVKCETKSCFLKYGKVSDERIPSQSRVFWERIDAQVVIGLRRTVATRRPSAT